VAKTNTHYVDLLLRQAGNLGLDVAAILEETGIASQGDEDPWIDNDYLSRLVKVMWRETGDETIGLGSTTMRLGSWALACDYMLAAENLGELYRRGARICSFLPPEEMGINLSVVDGSASVEILCYEGDRDPHHFLVEFLCVVWHRFPCWAIDEYIPVQQGMFRYVEPAHGWFYEELLQAPVEFGQSFNGFSFNRKYLSRPLCRNRAELEAWLHNSPADLLYLPGRDTSIHAHIRRQLASELEENRCFPAFDDICASLHMSTQVVRRRLAQEGTSYQKIKDAVRLDTVKELLAKPDLAIADIAERVGFTEPAALSRAFKKWTGQTPAQYRDRKAVIRGR
jgi:AraC-like DNA-binding protein